MSLTEVCLIVIALSAVAVGAAAVFVASRVVPLMRRFEDLAVSAKETVQKVDALVADMQSMARDARHTQSRIGNLTSEILNILEPSVNTVSAVVGVLRSGLTSLLGIRGSRGRDTFDDPRDSGTAPTG